MATKSESLYYVCEKDGTCHCDFRLTVKDCYDADRLKTVYYLTIGITFTVICLGLFLLYKRICVQGQRFVDRRASKGCLRPQPVDCVLLFCTIFNILRLVDCLLLVTDAADHPIVRMFFWEVAWEFLNIGFVLYVLGVFQTLRDSHQVVSEGWLPNATVIDISISFLIATMVTTNMTCAFVSGTFSESNHSLAKGFTYGLYYCWFAYCSILVGAILYCGARLIRILESHLKKFTMPRHRVNNIRNGIFKIKVMVSIGFVGSIIYGVSMLMFAILRERILTAPGGGLTLSIIWNINGAVFTGIVKLSILLSVSSTDMSKVTGLQDSSKDNSNTHGSSNFNSEYESTNSGKYHTYTDATNTTTKASVPLYESWQVRPPSLHDAERLQLEYQKAIHNLNHYTPPNTSTNHSTTTNTRQILSYLECCSQGV